MGFLDDVDFDDYEPPEQPGIEEQVDVEGAIERRIPRRFQEATFESWDTDRFPRALKVCRGFAEAWPEPARDGDGVLLCGPVGTGKTHLLWATFRALLEPYEWEGEAYLPPRQTVVTYQDLIEQVSPKRSDDEILTRLRTWKQADILYLDDLGKGRRTPWAAEHIGSVIDTRYQDQRPTFVTSNYTLPEIESFESEGHGWVAIADRLAEMCHPVEMEGESYR